MVAELLDKNADIEGRVEASGRVESLFQQGVDFPGLAIEGIAGRAGLVLCGLYGEPPEVLGRLVHGLRLIEPDSLAFQHLIRADHQSAGMPARDMQRL